MPLGIRLEANTKASGKERHTPHGLMEEVALGNPRDYFNGQKNKEGKKKHSADQVVRFDLGFVPFLPPYLIFHNYYWLAYLTFALIEPAHSLAFSTASIAKGPSLPSTINPQGSATISAPAS